MIDLVGRSVAVVGAGVSGLQCAQRVQDAGCVVQLLDKSANAGGRLATRIRPEGTWNHGAQQLGITRPEFADFAGNLIAAEVGELTGSESALTGLPNMRELLRPAADQLECRFDCAVGDVARVAGGWRLLDQEGGLHGDYAALVLALPAPQAQRLLAGINVASLAPNLGRELARLHESLDTVSYSSCWSLLVQGSRLPDALAANKALQALDASGRDVIAAIYPQTDPQCWVVHASAAWSEQALGEDRASVAQSLLMELKAACSAGAGLQVDHVEAHRWRYANVERAAATAALWSSGLGLGLCGDWCQPQAAPDKLNPAFGAETAFLSGLALAKLMCA